jgi:glycosyltransferase involved in cell wall biosynthesis
MAEPLVSVCVPTYNRPGFLAASLRSICAQSYERLEILVSDNASTDETATICHEFAAKDPRVRYVRHAENIGLYPNHNFCIETAQGGFLCFFHDDDEYGPDIIARYVEFMTAHPAVGLVCSDWALIDDRGEVVGTRAFDVPAVRQGYEYIEQTLRTGRSSVALSGVMLRREALDTIRFGDRLVGFEDFVVWFRMAERWDVGHIGERLWRYRLHQGALSRGAILRMTRHYRENLFRYCDDHLARHPGRLELVQGWKRRIDTYLFWALFYETARHFKRLGQGGHPASRGDSVFDLQDYALTAADLANVIGALRLYRTGALQRVAFTALRALLASRCTWPLACATRYSAAFRRWLGLGG